jgi:hypothetical protein
MGVYDNVTKTDINLTKNLNCRSTFNRSFYLYRSFG